MQGVKLSSVGMMLGACALLLAVIHFWAGPFSPTPSLEAVVAAKTVAIRDVVVATLGGKAAPTVPASPWDLDRTLMLLGSVLGAAALVLAVLGFVRNEPARACGGAAALGGAALAFQFVVIAVAAVVLAILVGALLKTLA